MLLLEYDKKMFDILFFILIGIEMRGKKFVETDLNSSSLTNDEWLISFEMSNSHPNLIDTFFCFNDTLSEGFQEIALQIQLIKWWS